MPKYLFHHLQADCRAKGVVCERSGRKVELTTPDGSVTAECDTVAEAIDAFHYDATFASLPVKVGR